MLPPLLCSLNVVGQGTSPATGARAPANLTAAPPARVTVPAGTRVPLSLRIPITTKNAQPGDPVYLQTSFPVAQDDRVLIPPGTYVDGIIDSVQRPGRVKGRGELRMHFTKLTFPNGYTVLLPGSAESVPGAEKWRVTDKEGTIQADPQRGQDAGTVGGTAATGAAIGGIGYGGKGAGIVEGDLVVLV